MDEPTSTEGFSTAQYADWLIEVAERETQFAEIVRETDPTTFTDLRVHGAAVRVRGALAAAREALEAATGNGHYIHTGEVPVIGDEEE